MAETKAQPITPHDVAAVKTEYREIQTQLPAPESVPTLEKLRTFEPRSMSGQPPIVWDRAEGIHIYDKYGNKWIDWSSGVLVTNAGHNHPKIKQAMIDQINHGLVHNYCFPSEPRAKLAEMLVDVAPEGLDKVFLLTTGSEATECAIKLARTNGMQIGGPDKITIVTFDNAFHGRTLGAQMAGGIPGLKSWVVNLDPDMIQVPFPDGFRGGPDTSFDLFLQSLADQNVDPSSVAGVMTETYQGGNSSFAPPEYMQKMRTWCDEHDIVLICDEVQAGFGRTGKFWGFEHYDITPDLICCGKGISSGMPLSAVIGRTQIMDQYPPGSMTSTHTGNPICATAAVASLQVIAEEKLVENSAAMGEILQAELRRIWKAYPENIGMVHGKGLVAALHMVVPGGIDPDPEMASRIVMGCVERGVMLFAPVGYAGASVKISPPLCITEAPLRESIAVLEEVLEEVLA